MNPKNLFLIIIACSFQTIAIAQKNKPAIYKSGQYSISATGLNKATSRQQRFLPEK